MSKVTGLGVDDEAFLVSSLIDRCPKIMMLRELVQNALEAASQAPDVSQVRIGAVEIDGVRKLRIWNTGPGMDADALYRMCDLASSIGKVKGLDRNFGMGAKVASLPSNHHGVRYRSCTGGRVSEVILGKRDGVYGRLLRPSPGRAYRPGAERLVDVADVTVEATESGVPTDHDWTEVVLFGQDAAQDTTVDPYGGEPQSRAYWLPQALYHRYFDIPADVALVIEPGLHWFAEPRTFEPLKRRALTAFAGYEAVQASNGITLHYLHDPQHAVRALENVSSEGALQTSSSLVAIVWRNEMYEVQHGSPWFYEAPVFGFTFGGRHLSVLIELADDYPVLPDAYRQFIRYVGAEQQQVRPKDFAGLVRECQPAWVRDIARRTSDGRVVNAAIVAEFGNLAGRLGLDRLSDAKTKTDSKADASGKGKAKDKGATSSAGLFAGVRAACGVEPVLLRSASDVRDRWLEGRAACFYPETQQLFVNMGYEGLLRFQAQLFDAAKAMASEATLRPLIESVTEGHYVRRLVRAVLFGLAKHLNEENWQKGHIEKAISPEALSTNADDFDDLVPGALVALRDHLIGGAEHASVAVEPTLKIAV
jgi:hypothetical protein